MIAAVARIVGMVKLPPFGLYLLGVLFETKRFYWAKMLGFKQPPA
jgi:hypothetical protein